MNDDGQNFFEIKWKNTDYINKNMDSDHECYDYLSESIRNSMKNVGLSICDDRDEIDTIYTELDQSMAQK